MNRFFKTGTCLWLAISCASQAQFGPRHSPAPSKKEQKVPQLRDPTISRNMPLAKFDDASEEARERSGKPGVLQAKTPEPDRIYEIRVEGTKKTEAEAVLILLKSHINEPLNPEDVAGDIH